MPGKYQAGGDISAMAYEWLQRFAFVTDVDVPVVESDVAVVEAVRLTHRNAVDWNTDLIDVRSACSRLAKRTTRVT